MMQFESKRKFHSVCRICRINCSNMTSNHLPYVKKVVSTPNNIALETEESENEQPSQKQRRHEITIDRFFMAVSSPMKKWVAEDIYRSHWHV